MFSLLETTYGLKVVFWGSISSAEMAQWANESARLLHAMPSSFGALLDFRKMKPLSRAAELEMHRGRLLFMAHGMRRSVVLYNRPVKTLQFEEIDPETGIRHWIRTLSRATNGAMETMAEQWLLLSNDPIEAVACFDEQAAGNRRPAKHRLPKQPILIVA